MSERRRKKANPNEISDDEWIVVRTKLAEVRHRLSHGHVEGEPKGDIEGKLEDYITQCGKAMQTGKREDLPKYFQTKLNEQKRERENKALEQSSIPPKTAESAPKPTITEATSSTIAKTVAIAIVHAGKWKATAPEEKQKEQKQK